MTQYLANYDPINWVYDDFMIWWVSECVRKWWYFGKWRMTRNFKNGNEYSRVQISVLLRWLEWLSIDLTLPSLSHRWPWIESHCSWYGHHLRQVLSSPLHHITSVISSTISNLPCVLWRQLLCTIVSYIGVFSGSFTSPFTHLPPVILFSNYNIFKSIFSFTSSFS